MKFEYIGKSLILEEKGEITLVIGDLHLGYEGSMRKSGIMIPVRLYDKIIDDFNKIIDKIDKKIENIIFLGDLKHEFGTILPEEWKNIINFIEYVKKRCKNLIIIEGNHDNILFPILNKLKIIGNDYYFWKNIAFCHGDKKIEEIYLKNIDYWVVGHGHPAISLYDGAKKERYKCFLSGKYKENNEKYGKIIKNIIIVPSFFPLIEGTDAREHEMKFAWNFDLDNFEVIVVGDDLKDFKFGKLKNIN